MAETAKNGWTLLESLDMAKLVRNCLNGWEFMNMAKWLIVARRAGNAGKLEWLLVAGNG